MGDSSGTNPLANTGAGIEELVERFERNIDAYRQQKYNETLVRRDFIDPMFAALGWDIDNRAGYAEAYRDVIHEDAIKVGGATKAPDYCFRVGGTRKFFVEAKKPAVDIAHDIHPAYQLRRYGWSAKLPLSILTDFEEFAVYDCRIRPKQGDKASTARTMYFTFDSYVAQWDKIASIFAKEAVLQGSFDKYVIGRKKRGTAEVDAEFLKEIEKWRAALARNIARQNSALGVREINFAVQRTIDRIIFLRMCEARGAEQHGALQALTNGIDVYGRLMQMFRAADDRYNSGLFHFNAESGRDHSPDTLTPALRIDDKVLKDIFNGLYYPTSPYEFSVLPADILGNVYEQFLGKVIHLTQTHQARVEEKPEVKKAGGVYYTPKYIVDYIVRHTVGKLIGAANATEATESSAAESSPGGAQDGSPGREAGRQIAPQKRARKGRKKQPAPKTPRQIAKLKILDPACGSGSFLVGAYKYLLDYHRDWYRNEKNGGPEKHTKEIYQGRGGQWYLTTAAKKRILLNNIYGVDIDSQAVEVTKLNLLLCVLENENQNTIGQMSLIHERVLPDLSDNIKCGNSLIGSDFYDGQQLTLFDTEAQYRINAFDWETEFPQIFKGKNPGFDAVIGNPPYVRMEGFTDTKEYLRKSYKAHEERADLYAYFVERALQVLKVDRFLGMIVSNKFIKAKYGRPLREIMHEVATINTIADFAGANVFVGATVRTVVLFLRKGLSKRSQQAIYVPVPKGEVVSAMAAGRLSVSDYAQDCCYSLSQSALTPEEWQLRPKEHNALMHKIRDHAVPLAKWLGQSALFGLKTGFNKAFVINESERERLIGLDSHSADVIRPILFGKDVRRYHTRSAGRYVIYCHPDKNIRDYPPVYEYMVPHRARLQQRAGKQAWYELQQPAVALLKHLAVPKIAYPIIADKCRFTLDVDGYFVNDKAFILPSDDLSLLALLNSKLGNFYFATVCAALEGPGARYLEFRAQYVDIFPIHENVVTCGPWLRLPTLTQEILQLHKSLPLAKTDHDKTLLQRQITTTDHQIDKLVYELYGLSDDEIGIVEEEGA